MSDLKVFLLLFSQAFSIQIAFYPLVLLSFARLDARRLLGWGPVAGCLLIVTMAASILLRGGSVELMIKLLQFYFGIALVMAAFASDRKLSIGAGAVWMFAIFVLYEVVSYNVFGIEPLIYGHSDFGGEMDFVDRAQIGEAHILARAYGPAANSSVSGSILAIAFFMLLGRKNGQGRKYDLGRILLLLTLLISVVFCGSATSFAICGLLLIHALIRTMRSPSLSTESSASGEYSVVVFWPLAIIAAIGLLSYFYFFSSFVGALIESKLNLDYFKYIFTFKLSQASQIGDFFDLLFGTDLANVMAADIGGDFVLLDAVLKLGLLGILSLFALLFCFCPPENRIFLLAGCISSFHYGTLFTLCGQVFFGALCANAMFYNPAPQENI